MPIPEFSVEEKAAAFDEIAKHYYSSNFGSISKSDLDTLIFTIFLRHHKKHGSSTDDYTLSKTLGITQGRIRSLKQKSQLQYPESISWKESFATYIQNARYDEVKRLVKVTIPEINIMIELRHFLEEHGWYDEYQLNPKLFQCRLDIFILICAAFDDEPIVLTEEAREKIEQLENTLPDGSEKGSLKKILKGSFEDGAKDFFKNAGTSLICELLKMLPFGTVAGDMVKWIIKLLEK